MGLKHGSLFSGIGGFDLAAEWMGWENIFHCEWNEFGQRVLKHYWPNADSLHDIIKTDFTKYEGSIDIISGGFPCQPYSTAGKRLGKEDDRHLWPEMLRAIREIKPTWVVGENVRGLVNWNEGLVFDEVQFDLEAEGYEVQPFLLPAAAVNAPHRRDRIWFVAYSNECYDRRSTEENERESGEERLSERHEIRKSVEPGEVQRNASFASCQRCDNGSDNWQERYLQDNIDRDATKDKSERSGWECGVGEVEQIGNATYSNGKRRYEIMAQFTGEKGLPPADLCNIKNNRVVTNSERSGPPREEHGQKKSRQHPQTNPRGWWANFPTQSPIRSGNDGLPDRLDGITFSKWRNESIKAYGNAIVPQVALQIFKAIDQYENIKRGKDNN